MAITGIDNILTGLISNPLVGYSKASLASMVAGQYGSLWRATGYPTQATIPGAVANCTNATVGAFPIPTATGLDRVLAYLEYTGAAAGNCLIVEDRLQHMGGLVGNVATAQTVNVDISVTTNNMVARVGATDYSECAFWLEWYTATGATIATATCAVTYHDSTTGTIAVVLPATVAASRRYLIQPTNGKFIKSIQTVTLSVSTGTAGSFGVTATRQIASITCLVANWRQQLDWATLGAPKVADEACVAFSQFCITTTTGIATGSLKFAVA